MIFLYSYYSFYMYSLVLYCKVELFFLLYLFIYLISKGSWISILFSVLWFTIIYFAI